MYCCAYSHTADIFLRFDKNVGWMNFSEFKKYFCKENISGWNGVNSLHLHLHLEVTYVKCAIQNCAVQTVPLQHGQGGFCTLYSAHTGFTGADCRLPSRLLESRFCPKFLRPQISQITIINSLYPPRSYLPWVGCSEVEKPAVVLVPGLNWQLLPSLIDDCKNGNFVGDQGQI